MIKHSEISANCFIVADEGFDCLAAGPHRVYKDQTGFYVSCRKGNHYLEPDTHGEVVGFEKYQGKHT